MRSENYLDQVLTFTRFDVPHMIRAALVGGLVHADSRYEEYKDFMQRFTALSAANIDGLRQLMRQETFARGQALELARRLPNFYPRGERAEKVWRQLNYEALQSDEAQKSGVIISVGTDLDDLVARALDGKIWEVLALKEPIVEKDADYRKHIPRRNKIILDSEQTIDAFSQQHSMALDAHWNGQVNDNLIQRLKGANYTLSEAIITALLQQQNSGGKHSVISFTNYATGGDEVRIFPIDLVEMVEMFTYFREHRGAAARFKLGDEAQKYAGTKTLLVPKRHPTETFEWNQAAVDYIADFHRGPLFYNPVWWLNFRADCTCDYSRDMENFNMAVGEKKYKAIIFDPHIGAAILTILDSLTQKQDFRLYLPIPSKEILALADYARFNMYVVGEDSKRRPLREDVINILLLHAMKSGPKKAFSQPGTEKVTPYILQHLFA